MLAPGVLDARRFECGEADGKTAHQAGLDRLPGFVKAILERAGFVDLDDAGLDDNAGIGDGGGFDMADRRIGIVLPKQRQRQFEDDAARLDDIAHAIRCRRAGDAFDDAFVFTDRFDGQQRVSAFHLGHSGLQKCKSPHEAGFGG